MRELMAGYGKDLFTSTRNRKGLPKLTGPCCRFHVDDMEEWVKLPDPELLQQFETLVMLSYRQR